MTEWTSKAEQMLKRAIVIVTLAGAAGISTTVAEAAQKIVSFSICAGSGCHNNASQHDFTHSGAVKVPTGLPEAVKVQSLTYGCAAFCSHAALWPAIVLEKGHDGSYFYLDAHHSGAIGASSNARQTVLTLNVFVRY